VLTEGADLPLDAALALETRRLQPLRRAS
jgi:hypothetical protein